MSEQLARQFHEIYERLAPSFGYETRTETREFDPTSANGRLMIAVCTEIASNALGDIERLQMLYEQFVDRSFRLEYERNLSRSECDKIQRERDEARRMYCAAIALSAGLSAKRVAEDSGWDCYAVQGEQP